MQLDSIFILLIATILGGVLSEHTRTKRLMYALCPPQFIGIGSLCYYISNYKASWLEAQFECKDKNSKLAEPIKLADKKLRRYLQEFDKERNDIWIGGTFDWQTEKWTWGYSGKDINYNSFSQLDLGSSKDMLYHCAVLDPNQKYRWSSRSCVDQHRFVCQHKMPRVSENNRVRIYNRWNESYPNQLANEVVLELKDNDHQRINKVVRGHNTTYYFVDCNIHRHYVNSDIQRRRRMRPYHGPVLISTASSTILPTTTIASTTSPPTTMNPPSTTTTTTTTTTPSKTFNNDVHIELIPDPLIDGFNTNPETKYYRGGEPKSTIPPNMNEINSKTRPGPRQKAAFDLEIEEKRRRARERRRRERRKEKQHKREQRQHEIKEQERLNSQREAEQKRLQEEVEKKRKSQVEEMEALQKQIEEHEIEQKQNEKDQMRIKEIQEQKRAQEIEENEAKEQEEHQRIVSEREHHRKQHESELIHKSLQHDEWRRKLGDNVSELLLNNEERLKLIKQQEEEYKKLEEERKAEENKRLDEELARLENERKQREERQKAREEKIRARQELLKQQEEEEKRLQEEIRQQEEEARKAKEEEEKRKEKEKKEKEAEELRKKMEREERARLRKLKQQKAQEEWRRLEREEALEEKKRKQKEFRDRLSKLTAEEQILFFKRREERSKRKRLAQIDKNDVPIPE